MKILQIMPTVSFGDAVSNDARAIDKVISDMGYKTGIYAENIDARLSYKSVHKISELPKTTKDDIIIFNHSTGTDLCYKLRDISGHKIMIYHNITPPKFLEGYSLAAAKLCEYGYKGTKDIADIIEMAMVDSIFNAEELKSMGYKCPMNVRPILIPFEDYEQKPDKKIIDQFANDGFVNILFVGRIVPNKKQEDVIAAFSYYKKHINSKSRLILVGSDNGMENYSRKLRKYADALLLDDVIFTGHISFNAILAWYRSADVFLCMSEHEGFCVPLVEAMYFDLPIIAFDSSAIGNTLGGSGLLIDSKDPIEISLLIDRLVNDKTLKDEIISGQRERLRTFAYDRIKELFITQLNGYIESIK